MLSARERTMAFVRGHEKVSTGGQGHYNLAVDSICVLQGSHKQLRSPPRSRRLGNAIQRLAGELTPRQTAEATPTS